MNGPLSFNRTTAIRAQWKLVFCFMHFFFMVTRGVDIKKVYSLIKKSNKSGVKSDLIENRPIKWSL